MLNEIKELEKEYNSKKHLPMDETCPLNRKIRELKEELVEKDINIACPDIKKVGLRLYTKELEPNTPDIIRDRRMKQRENALKKIDAIDNFFKENKPIELLGEDLEKVLGNISYVWIYSTYSNYLE